MAKVSTVRLFTSESVCAGHSDKIADAISDAIVDATLAKDPKSHTAIDLARPIYSQTSAYGHFGKDNLPRERIAKR